MTAKKIRYLAMVNSQPRPMVQILKTEETIRNLVNPNENKKIKSVCWAYRVQTKKNSR